MRTLQQAAVAADDHRPNDVLPSPARISVRRSFARAAGALACLAAMVTGTVTPADANEEWTTTTWSSAKLSSPRASCNENLAYTVCRADPSTHTLTAVVGGYGEASANMDWGFLVPSNTWRADVEIHYELDAAGGGVIEYAGGVGFYCGQWSPCGAGDERTWSGEQGPGKLLFTATSGDDPFGWGSSREANVGVQLDLRGAGHVSGYASATMHISTVTMTFWHKAQPATAPSSPVGVVATDTTTSSIRLAWSAPGSANADSYSVYEVLSSGVRSLAGSTAETAFTHTGLQPGRTITYVVTAVNAAGESPPSEPVTATTRTTVPGAVPALTATPRSKPAKQRGIRLEWSVPATDGGSPITGYRIYRGMSESDLQPLTSTTSTTSYDDTSTRTGTTYYFAVAALNANGEGQRSPIRSAVGG